MSVKSGDRRCERRQTYSLLPVASLHSWLLHVHCQESKVHLETCLWEKSDESYIRSPTKIDKLEQKLSGISDRRIRFYCFGFFFCELLNLISVVICFYIFDTLLGGKFWSYGSDYIEFNQDESDRKANPMCHVFPTEVSCDVGTGAITGGGNVDNKNVICILSNNLFNQYYFFILWIWWTFLIIISTIGLVYRVMQISIPWFCQEMFFLHHDIKSDECVKLRSKQARIWDFFFLSRLTSNLDGEEIESLLNELVSNKAFLVQVDGEWKENFVLNQF